MSEITRVDPDAMNNTSKEIIGKISDWDTDVNELYALQEELDAMWDGNANDEFNRQWNEDKSKYQSLSDYMVEYCQAITTAANNYVQCENDVAGIVKGR